MTASRKKPKHVDLSDPVFAPVKPPRRYWLENLKRLIPGETSTTELALLVAALLFMTAVVVSLIRFA